MSYSVQQCLDRARECEWRASQAKDSVAKGEFIELVRQWQELAREKEGDGAGQTQVVLVKGAY